MSGGDGRLIWVYWDVYIGVREYVSGIWFPGEREQIANYLSAASVECLIFHEFPWALSIFSVVC